MPTEPWPAGFERIPDAAWTRASVDALALNYDTVENHGWYRNLDPTVRDVAAFVPDDGIVVDYSGGTGILIHRLLDAVGDRRVGLVNVDSSARFLRAGLDTLAHEARVAFRRLRYLHGQARLQRVDEVLGKALAARGVDALVSTNALHLYDDLDGTVAGWRRVLRPGGRLFVQSGNVTRRGIPDDRWILDDTLHAVTEAAMDVVQDTDAFVAYRPALADPDRMRAHANRLDRVFHPPHPVEAYTTAFRDAGFLVRDVQYRPVPVTVAEWYGVLSMYHDVLVGWVGGSPDVEGKAPGARAVRDRQRILREALDRVLDGEPGFVGEWTYVTCDAPA